MSALAYGEPEAHGEGLRCSVVVPHASALFDGHFHGLPILPAIAQLELFAELALSLAPDAPRLAAIERARFRAPVEPDDRLAVHVTPLDAGGGERRFAFRATRAEQPVADGGLRLGRALDEAPPDGRAQPRRADPTPIDVPTLPHGEAARLLEDVLERDDAGALCRARVPTCSPFRRGARVPALLAIEMAAQAAGALDERTGAARGVPPPGLLVSVRDARLFASDLPADERYHVRVRRESASDALLIARFDVTLDGWALAAGALTLRAGAGA